MTIDQVGDGMEPFAAVPNATCGLASRYDGLDLPNDACRAVVLEGMPDQDNLQDRFLSEWVKAGAAIAERIRTRVVQGAGRCTRGPNDWAVVIVLGDELTKYLLRPETQRAGARAAGGDPVRRREQPQSATG
jgi:Rad3-related DNA helicase